MVPSNLLGIKRGRLAWIGWKEHTHMYVRTYMYICTYVRRSRFCTIYVHNYITSIPPWNHPRCWKKLALRTVLQKKKTSTRSQTPSQICILATIVNTGGVKLSPLTTFIHTHNVHIYVNDTLLCTWHCTCVSSPPAVYGRARSRSSSATRGPLLANTTLTVLRFFGMHFMMLL